MRNTTFDFKPFQTFKSKTSLTSTQSVSWLDFVVCKSECKRKSWFQAIINLIDLMNSKSQHFHYICDICLHHIYVILAQSRIDLLYWKSESAVHIQSITHPKDQQFVHFLALTLILHRYTIYLFFFNHSKCATNSGNPNCSCSNIKLIRVRNKYWHLASHSLVHSFCL